MTPRALFDAHLHIIAAGFPLIANDGYLPPRFDCEAYLQRMADYHVLGGAVVSASFQGFDTGYLLAALERLGPGFVGVAQLPASVGDEAVLALAAAGVRGVRFNLRRGGSAHLEELEALAWRVHALAGWHVELYADAAQLVPFFTLLTALPRVSIDHLGLSHAGLPTLLRLAERGVYVKASGFGRVDLAVPTALRELHAANPAALMFGTDLPSTRAPRAYRDADIDLVVASLGEAGAARVLHDNARDFYRLTAQ